MIHVVHADNRAVYARELDEMFRLRAKFFKDVLGWSALTVTDGLEKDEYDDEQAIYLLALEDDGGLSVSVRLRPTRDRSLLFDHFPHLVAADPDAFTQHGVWESCRYFASGRARGNSGARRREELRLAMVEAARSAGVQQIVAITDTVFLPSLVQASWTTRLIGLPAAYAEGECVALEIDCSEAALLRMQERLGEADSVLLDLSPSIVPNHLRPHEVERLFASHGIESSEVVDILTAAQTLSGQDMRVLINLIDHIRAIHDAQGPIAAQAIIESVAALVKAEGAMA